MLVILRKPTPIQTYFGFNCLKTETVTYRNHNLQKKKNECSQMGIAEKKWKEGEILHSSVLYIIITACS